MGGVCDEAPLAPSRVLERGEHGVEAPGQAAELVRSLVRHPPREVAGGGHLLGRLGQAPHGRERGAGDGEPERGAQADAAQGDEDEDRAQVGQGVVDLGERAGDLNREPVGRPAP